MAGPQAIILSLKSKFNKLNSKAGMSDTEDKFRLIKTRVDLPMYMSVNNTHFMTQDFITFQIHYTFLGAFNGNIA